MNNKIQNTTPKNKAEIERAFLLSITNYLRLAAETRAEVMNILKACRPHMMESNVDAISSAIAELIEGIKAFNEEKKKKNL